MSTSPVATSVNDAGRVGAALVALFALVAEALPVAGPSRTGAAGLHPVSTARQNTTRTARRSRIPGLLATRRIVGARATPTGFNTEAVGRRPAAGPSVTEPTTEAERHGCLRARPKGVVRSLSRAVGAVSRTAATATRADGLR